MPRESLTPFTLDWCWMRFKDNFLFCKLALLTKIPSHWKVFVHFRTLNHLEFKASVGQTRIMESHFNFFTSWGCKTRFLLYFQEFLNSETYKIFHGYLFEYIWPSHVMKAQQLLVKPILQPLMYPRTKSWMFGKRILVQILCRNCSLWCLMQHICEFAVLGNQFQNKYSHVVQLN